MGTSASKPMEKYTFEKKPVGKLNLGEKELRCTKIELEYREGLKRQMGNWSAKKRAQLLKPVNNDVEGEYKFKPIEIPLDSEGYCQSFTPDKKQAISDFFSVYGFVVVRDCLTQAAVEDSVEEVWDFVERHVRGVDRADHASWGNWTSLATLGYLGTASVLSPQFAANRTNASVYAVFRNLLQEDDLYVNVAGAGAHRPTKQVPFKAAALRKLRKEGVDLGDLPDLDRDDDDVVLIDRPDWQSKDGRDWLHWDMNPFTGAVSTAGWAVQDADSNKGYRLRVQGFLALTDCRADDGGFFCVPGAHKLIRKWAKHHVEDAAMKNRVLDPFANAQYFIPANDPMKDAGQEVPVRAGSLLVWNSALPHCNYPNRSDRFRMVQYITMTSATGGDFAPLFTDEDLLRPVPDYKFSAMGKRLHGFEPWVAIDVLDAPYAGSDLDDDDDDDDGAGVGDGYGDAYSAGGSGAYSDGYGYGGGAEKPEPVAAAHGAI